MNKAVNRLKQAWEDNPLAVIAVGSAAAIAASKLINSMSDASNARAWKKEVARRDRMTPRKR